MKMMWTKILIQGFLLSAVECGSHSLEFLSTGRVHPGDQPQFEQLSVFDGVPISYCGSLTKREVLKPTLESKDFPEYCHEANENILESLYAIPPFINSTMYVVQRRRGCSHLTNGHVSAFDAWAVNGMDFISFDPVSQRWISQSPSAVILKHHWNNNNARNMAFRNFIREQCPLMIQRIKLRSMQQNTELHIFAKPGFYNAQALLRCHVTTTDKSVRSVHLIGDGASKASWITITGPVPSGDGSVILRLTAGISLSQNPNTYSCGVQAGGHNITVFWDGNTLDGRQLLNKSSIQWKILIIITGFCCIILVITVISCGMFGLKCGMKSRRPPRVDPWLMEQLTRMTENLNYPDLQSVIVSYTQNTEGNREWDEWIVRIMSRDQNFYNPEHFANQVDGALR